MTRRVAPVAAAIMMHAALSSGAVADTQFDIYRALGLKTRDIVTGTVLRGPVLPGGEKQSVAVITFMTGKKDKADAVNVILAVFRRVSGELQPVFERDYGAGNDGNVGRGELQLFDFDLDGIHEIVVTWDDHGDRLTHQRRGEILTWTEDGFRAVWSDVIEYDATRDARQVPEQRRDRWVREIDYEQTLRTRGVTLFMDRTVLAVAGETLPEPKTVEETFPLKRSQTPR